MELFTGGAGLYLGGARGHWPPFWPPYISEPHTIVLSLPLLFPYPKFAPPPLFTACSLVHLHGCLAPPYLPHPPPPSLPPLLVSLLQGCVIFLPIVVRHDRLCGSVSCSQGGWLPVNHGTPQMPSYMVALLRAVLVPACACSCSHSVTLLVEGPPALKAVWRRKPFWELLNCSSL